MDWTEQNRLVTQQLQRNGESLISPITEADRALYRRFFAADDRPACYGNSWTYITQACRGLGLGLKYFDGDLLASIGCYRGHYVVVRPMGALDGRVMDLLDSLHSVSGKPVFVKKLFPDQVVALRQMGNFQEAARYDQAKDRAVPGSYPWDPEAPADDDTYPEMILDVDLTLRDQLPFEEWFVAFQEARVTPTSRQTMKSLQNHHRRFWNRVRRFRRLEIPCHLVEYKASMADQVRAYLLDYFGTERQQDVAAYDNLLTCSLPDTNPDDFLSMLAYPDDYPAPIGFFFAERLDAQAAGLYAGVVSRQCPGLSEYLYTEMLARLDQAGVKQVTLGGSETRELHRFKRKLAPVEERVMYLLVYGANQNPGDRETK